LKADTTLVDEDSWLHLYTLGAGDVVNIRFFGRPDLDRAGIRIAPDGTLSYLQVNSLPVAGLSIDGLRTAMELELARFFRNPRLIITPGELVSKRYVILGKVIDNG
ncbi:polysaccharide biosynthesis/export family protein, partial [Arthrospira platensis SPKY1]|nr:polysaccharide biosynthesis/export family protein [Arthrospira platensis SPKY1]